MILDLVHIRELAGWGFDDYKYRPQALGAKQTAAVEIVSRRLPLQQADVVLAAETEQVRAQLQHHAGRPDLLSELGDLSWSLGVVDLRPLIAFQRRLALRPLDAKVPVPHPEDWRSLLDLCFGPAKPVECATIRDRTEGTVVLRSGNPNLHFRFTNDPASPLRVHAGGTFFEVACFRNRWFLRDGYHRAYAMLGSGVFAVPAVIVHAATLEELGANQPWFFPEDVLFAEAPPCVIDFLNPDLVVEYDRPALMKTLRIKLEETLEPVPGTGE